MFVLGQSGSSALFRSEVQIERLAASSLKYEYGLAVPFV